MEDSVKDLDGDINPSTPEPRFSIGSKSPESNLLIQPLIQPKLLKK